MSLTSGRARRLAPSDRDVARLRKYGASESYIAIVTAEDEVSAPFSARTRPGRVDTYRRTRWKRAAFASSTLSAIPAIFVLIELPELLERGSPLIWLAISVGVALSFQAMLLVVYAIGWAVFHYLLGQAIDRTYATIETVAAFMPVRGAESYRAANVRAAGLPGRPAGGADRSPAEEDREQAALRARLRSTAVASVVAAWRQERVRKGEADVRSNTVGIASATVSVVLLVGFGLGLMTQYLMTLDTGATVRDLLALQVGVLGACTTVVSVVLYSR